MKPNPECILAEPQTCPDRQDHVTGLLQRMHMTGLKMVAPQNGLTRSLVPTALKRIDRCSAAGPFEIFLGSPPLHYFFDFEIMLASRDAQPRRALLIETVPSRRASLSMNTREVIEAMPSIDRT